MSGSVPSSSASGSGPTSAHEDAAAELDRKFVHFPRGVLIGAAVLMAVTATFAFIARTTDLGAHRLVPAATVASVDLQFITGADGAITIRDVGRNIDLQKLSAKSDGFIKIVLRSLTQERNVKGIDPAVTVRLSQLSDGQYILQDTVTGRIITISAFGSGNLSVFTQFLPKT